MQLQSLIGLCFLIVSVFVCIASLVHRFRSRGKRLHRKSPFGYFPRAALGNAFQTLQEIVQPNTRHAIVQMTDDQADEDDSCDPDHPTDPIAHLHRQAEMIRRGEAIDRITALLAKQD